MLTISNAGALATDSTVTAGGNISSTGEFLIGTIANFAKASAATVTDGAAFTPTHTYQQITAAGEVTPTVTAGATAGDLLCLINSGSNTINLADSGTAVLSAAWAAGQYDVLCLISDGTNWIEISRSDN